MVGYSDAQYHSTRVSEWQPFEKRTCKNRAIQIPIACSAKCNSCFHLSGTYVEVLELVAVEVSTDVDSFTTDNDNLLSAQQ